MMPAGFETEPRAEVKETPRRPDALTSVEDGGNAPAHGRLGPGDGSGAADAADGRAAQNGIVALINNDSSGPQPVQ